MEDTNTTLENGVVQTPKKKRKKSKKQQTIFLILLFLIPAINFLVFWGYLNISAVDYAFKVEQQDGTVKYSFDNFVALFQEMTIPGSTFWISLRNTLLYWFIGSVLSYVMAIFIGYFIFKKVPGHKWYKFIFYLPTLIAPTILTAIFKQIIQANGPILLFYDGDMNAVPRFLTSEELAIWTCLFYSFFFEFGSKLLIISGAMSQVDNSLLDAGKIDGVSMFGELFNIILPVIWPTVIATLIGSISGIFMASGPILLLTQGNYKTYTISYWIYAQVLGVAGTNYYKSAAVGLFFSALSLPLTFFSRWLLRRVVSSSDSAEED